MKRSQDDEFFESEEGAANSVCSKLSPNVTITQHKEPTSMPVMYAHALERSIFPEIECMHIADVVREPGVTLLCAAPDGDPTACVGYAVLQYDEQLNSTRVTKLAVSPLFQKRGIGRAILTEALRHAREVREATICTLHVDVSNAAARALYTSMGFKQRGEVHFDFYEEGRHAIEMALDMVAKEANDAASSSTPDGSSSSNRSPASEATMVADMATAAVAAGMQAAAAVEDGGEEDVVEI